MLRCVYFFLRGRNAEADPAIFTLALGIAQAAPEECIYVDDRLMLVQAVEKLGIRSFHHQTFSTTKRILEDFKNEK